MESPSPPLEAFNDNEESKDDDDFDDNNDDVDSNDGDDGVASSPSDDEMSTWHSYPFLLMTKKRSGFDYESSHT